jgi:hypothetical protein
MTATSLRGARILEILAVLLLGVATVGTAWCAYQSSQWTGTQTELARAASDERVEASRLFILASQRIGYDSMLVTDYAQARVEARDTLAQFYRQSLVRPGFLPVLDRWEATLQAGGQPTNLLEDTAYLDAQLTDYRAAENRAEELATQSTQAGEHAEDYVITTILLAVALFFAGVFSSFRFLPARVLLLLAAIATIAVAAARVAALPVA